VNRRRVVSHKTHLCSTPLPRRRRCRAVVPRPTAAPVAADAESVCRADRRPCTSSPAARPGTLGGRIMRPWFRVVCYASSASCNPTLRTRWQPVDVNHAIAEPDRDNVASSFPSSSRREFRHHVHGRLYGSAFSIYFDSLHPLGLTAADVDHASVLVDPLHCESKKHATKLLYISSPNTDRKKFFHRQVCNNEV